MDTHIHIEGLSSIFYGRAYVTIQNVLENIWRLGEYQDLTAELDTYVNALADDSDEGMIRNDINKIAYDFATTTILAKKHNIILNRPNVPDMELLSGLLDFISDSYNPETPLYDTVLSYINTDDTESEMRLALIVREYNDYVDVVDVYDGVGDLDQSSLAAIGTRMEDTRDAYDTASEEGTAYYDLVSDKDLDILDSRMFKYIMCNNKFDLTLQLGVSYIDNMSANMGSRMLGYNLGALGLLLSLEISEVMDIVNNMFYEHDTTAMFEYFNTILGTTDGY